MDPRSALVVHGFIKIRTIRMLGLVLSVFVQKKHLIHVKNMESQYTRLSLAGFVVSFRTGNICTYTRYVVRQLDV
jgi:hypothetical protein